MRHEVVGPVRAKEDRVDIIRDKIVTANSLRPTAAQREEAEALPDGQTPEAQLRLAEYEQVIVRLLQAAQEVGDDVLVTVRDRQVSLAQSWAAAHANEVRPLDDGGGVEAKFGTEFSGLDWFGWAWSLTSRLRYRKPHRLPRPTVSAADTAVGDLKVAMASDWGTGLYGAPLIAAAIRGMAHARKFDLLMHLGDVYYSGTKRETKERFLDIWPADAGVVNRALNGNHEMYSGGFGYFGLTLPQFQQKSSYFAVQNEHWVLIGLDTAYVDHDLDTQQVAWVNLILRQADLSRRKVVLFSHHQPFSRLESHAKGGDLQTALAHLLDEEIITAWYWGHEHQCIVYDQHEEWGLHGRCLGNGGIPQPRKAEVRSAPQDTNHPGGVGCVWRRLEANAAAPGCIVLDGPNIDMPASFDRGRFGPHGFMTLEFNGPELLEQVYHSNGTSIFSNVIR
jgi:hypothetical protein